MFIVLVYKDCDVYEYRYDTLEDAQKCVNNEAHHQCEIVCPPTGAFIPA